MAKSPFDVHFLLDMNDMTDEVLLAISGYFDLRERVVFTRINQSFRGSCEYWWLKQRSLKKEDVFKIKRTEYSAIKKLALKCPNLTTFDTSDFNQKVSIAYGRRLGSVCRNITTLILNYPRDETDVYLILFGYLEELRHENQIKKLILYLPEEEKHADDLIKLSSLMSLYLSPKLEHFQLTVYNLFDSLPIGTKNQILQNFRKINMENIKHLDCHQHNWFTLGDKLEELICMEWYDLSGDEWVSLVQKHPNLIKFNVQMDVRESSLKSLSEINTKLQCIHMNFDNYFDAASNDESEKKRMAELLRDYFRKWITKSGSQLKELKISDIPKLDTTGFWTLISENCPNVTLLEIRGDIQQSYDKELRDSLKTLTKLQTVYIHTSPNPGLVEEDMIEIFPCLPDLEAFDFYTEIKISNDIPVTCGFTISFFKEDNGDN